MKSGAELISEERIRQVLEEKYDFSHDRQVNKTGQLSWAAIAYAAPDRVYRKMGCESYFSMGDPFPWDIQYDARHRCEKSKGGQGHLVNPSDYTNEERVGLLVKAGALIAAEIDRLNRWEKEK